MILAWYGVDAVALDQTIEHASLFVGQRGDEAAPYRAATGLDGRPHVLTMPPSLIVPTVFFAKRFHLLVQSIHHSLGFCLQRGWCILHHLAQLFLSGTPVCYQLSPPGFNLWTNDGPLWRFCHDLTHVHSLGRRKA
jgi:hypothetical protein